MKQPYINSMLKRLSKSKSTYIKIVNIYKYPGARHHKFDTLQHKLNEYNTYSQYPGPRRNKQETNTKMNDKNEQYPGARFNKKDMDVDKFDYDIEHILKNGGL